MWFFLLLGVIALILSVVVRWLRGTARYVVAVIGLILASSAVLYGFSGIVHVLLH
jgi:hypothetical protein